MFYNAKMKLLFTALLSLADFLAIKKSKSLSRDRLLLVRLDSIGDYVLFRDFIRILKESEKYKNYKITLCGNVIWKNIAEVFDKDYIDEFIWVDRTELSNNLFYRLKVLKDINSRSFDVVVQPTFTREYFIADSVVKASSAREKIGSKGDKSTINMLRKLLSDRYYTRLIDTDQKVLFEFLRNKHFFESLLGIALNIERPSLDISKVKFKSLTKNNYVVFFPGAGDNFRKWDTSNFSQISDYLSDKYKVDIIICGDIGDKVLAEDIIAKSNKGNILDLTGKLSLSEFAKLFSNAILLVSNETGAVHISVAVSTKTICVSNGNHFGVFNPYPKDISKGVYYVYPEEIMKKFNDFEFLCQKYRYGSGLDINKINAKDVIEVIDKIIT